MILYPVVWTAGSSGGGGGGASDSFTTFQTDTGTSPVADGPTDTLTLTSDDTAAYSFDGDATTDTVSLVIEDASASNRGLVNTTTQMIQGQKTFANNYTNNISNNNTLYVQHLENISADVPGSYINASIHELSLYGNFDRTGGFGIASNSQTTLYDDSDIGYLLSSLNQATNLGDGIVDNLIGVFGGIYMDGAGSATNAVSYLGAVECINGTITDAVSFQGEILYTGGTLTNGYILRASTNDATNKWGFYLDIGTSENYLSGGLEIDERLQLAQGSDVTAANDLTLGTGNAFKITGNTTINAITTIGWKDGSSITLRFTGTPTVKHNTTGGAGTAVMLLAGSVDLSAANNTVLGLMLINGEWHEIYRKVA